MVNDMNVVVEFIETIADGGAESLVRDYATLVSNNEFKVVVVTIYPPLKTSANYKILKQNGAEIISIFPDHRYNIIHRVWNKLTNNSYVQQRLLKIIQKLNAKSIHVHLPILKHLKPIASQLIGIKLFYTCHTIPSRLFNTNNNAKEFDAAKYLIKHNNLILIALHDDMRVELNEMFSVDNTIVVHNGVDVDRFANVPDCRKDILHMLNIPEDAFIIGHIGRFNIVKNHLFLLDIFDALKDKQSNAFLLMVGSGPLKEQVEQKILALGIQNRCKILEHRTDIPELLKAMDVFLFPSVLEGLPVTLVEAQVANKRCVVSDTITPECFFSPEVVPLSLSAAPQKWAEAVLDMDIKGAYQGDISKFDMRNVVEHLREIYRS